MFFQVEGQLRLLPPLGSNGGAALRSTSDPNAWKSPKKGRFQAAVALTLKPPSLGEPPWRFHSWGVPPSLLVLSVTGNPAVTLSRCIVIGTTCCFQAAAPPPEQTPPEAEGLSFIPPQTRSRDPNGLFRKRQIAINGFVLGTQGRWGDTRFGVNVLVTLEEKGPSVCPGSARAPLRSIGAELGITRAPNSAPKSTPQTPFPPSSP